MSVNIDGNTGIDEVQPGCVKGITDGSNVPAGYVGEILSAAASVAGILNATAFTSATLNLSPGVWDVSGLLIVGGTSATISLASADVSSTASALNADSVALQLGGSAYTTAATGPLSIPTVTRRVVLTAPANVYLVGTFYFGSGTLATNASGKLTARRAA